MRSDTFPVSVLFICMDAIIDLEYVCVCVRVCVINTCKCKNAKKCMEWEMKHNSGIRLDYVFTHGLFLCSSLLFEFSDLQPMTDRCVLINAWDVWKK